MSAPRPEIFISATSGDLGSCRQAVKEALLTLGCTPIEQSNFPPDYRTVKGLLNDKIGDCHAVVHIAGECYGTEPVERPPDEPRRSYTQLEYALSRKIGKPCYVFICGEGFPYDEHEPESEELRELQHAHRQALCRGDRVYQMVADRAELDRRIRELDARTKSIQEELNAERRRRTVVQWVTILSLVLIIGLGSFFMHRMREEHQRWRKEMDDKMTLLYAKVNDWERARAGLTSQQRFDDGLREMSTLLNVPLEKLQADFARYAKDLRTRGVGKYGELLALMAEGDTGKLAQAAAAAHGEERKRIAGLAHVGGAAREEEETDIREHLMKIGAAQNTANQPLDALDTFREAQNLAHRDTEPFAWARATAEIVGCLIADGQFLQAEPLIREVVQIMDTEPQAKPEDRRLARQLLAFTLTIEGKTAEAAQFGESPRIVATSDRPVTKNEATATALSAMSSALQGGTDSAALMKGLLEIMNAMSKANLPSAYIGDLFGGLMLAVGGKHDEALDKLKTVRMQLAADAKLPPGFVSVLDFMIGMVLIMAERPAEAEPYVRQSIDGSAKLPSGSEFIANMSRMLLADVLSKTNRSEEAEKELRIARREMISRFGVQSPFIASIDSDLADLLIDRGRPKEAEPLLREMLAQPEQPGPTTAFRAWAINRLGNMLINDDRLAEARQIFENGLEFLERQKIGNPHRRAAFSVGLALIANTEKAYERTVQIAAENLPRIEALGDHSSSDFRFLLKLQAKALHRLNRHDEAVAATRHRVAAIETLTPPLPDVRHEAIYDLAWYLYTAGQHVEAESEYRRTLAFYVAQTPPNLDLIATIRIELADVLLATKRPTEAEKELRAAAGLLRQREKAGEKVENWKRCEDSFVNALQAQGKDAGAAAAEWKILREGAASPPSP